MEVVQVNVVNIALRLRDTKRENGSEQRNVGRSCRSKAQAGKEVRTLHNLTSVGCSKDHS
jgi:hypothetical protein